MIPILFTSDTTDFTTNGIGRLTDCVSCKVTEERNGVYELEMEYPISGELYETLIAQGGIIGAIHDDQHDIQPFDIYGYSAPISGIVTFYAHHISYRLNNVLLSPFTAGSAAEVMLRIPQYSVTDNPFTFWTDKNVSASFNLVHPETVRTILGGSTGSILDVFGTGEYEFDGLTVKLYLHRGTNSGVTIRYGKNMTDITHEKDSSLTYNAIAPYWMDTEGNVVYLDNNAVVTQANVPWTVQGGSEMYDKSTSGKQIIYFSPYPSKVVAMDFSLDFEEAPTKQQLQDRAADYLANNQPWLSKVNTTVDFVQLWQTDEYADVAALQRVHLCDYVSIYYPELGVIIENQEVIRVVYNVLLERFDEMELGKTDTNLIQSITDELIENTKKQINDFGSVMEQAIQHATDLITGGLGGHVVFNLNADGEPQEILIMDTDNISTAVNVIRMNQNGIGFSTSGYNGPFSTAWTIDGHFNADFITAGTLSANIIKAGILSDYAGKNSWNLLTGDMDIQGDITMVKGYVTALLGAVTVYYLVTGSSTLSYTQYSDNGLSIDYKPSGSTVNKLALVASDSQTSYATYIYGETTRNGAPHMRAYKSKESNVVYHVQESINKDIDFKIYDVSNNVLKNWFTIGANGGIGMYWQNNTQGNQFWKWFSVNRESISWQNTAGNFVVAIGNSSTTVGGITIGNQSGISTLPSIYLQKGQYAYNSYFNIRVSDSMQIGLTSGVNIYGGNSVSLTGATSAYVYWCTHVLAFESYSSRRYKHDIKPIENEELDPHKLLDLEVIQFVYNDDADLQYEDTRGLTIPGFIAEDMADIYPSAVIHNEKGQIESWDVRRVVPGMLALIQEQDKTIKEQQAKIDDLEERLAKLERLVMGN